MNMLRKFILENAREQWTANIRSKGATDGERDMARLAVAEIDLMIVEMMPAEKPTPQGTALGQSAFVTDPVWAHFDENKNPPAVAER